MAGIYVDTVISSLHAEGPMRDSCKYKKKDESEDYEYKQESVTIINNIRKEKLICGLSMS